MAVDSLVAAFEAEFPDEELIAVRDRVRGIEFLIGIPRALLAERAAKRLPPPFWRHGEVVDIRPAPVGGV